MASVKKIAEELNWELTDKRKAYGNYRGFSFSLIQNLSYTNQADNFKLLVVPFEDVMEDKAQNLLDYIRENKKELRVADFRVSQNMVSIRLNDVFKGMNGERLTEVLDLLITGLNEIGAETVKLCAYCSQEGADTFTYINDVKLPAHEACKQQAIREVQNEMNSRGKSSPMAFVGAILGAFVGVIPYAIALWFGWLIGLLSILTALASYKGYQMFGGVPKKSAIFLVGGVSFLMIILSNLFLMETLAIMYDVNIAAVLSVPELKSLFTETTLMSALFGLIGVGYIVRKINQEIQGVSIR